MKTIAKAALGGIALMSLGSLAASPANAAASFGFSFGTGPVYGGYYGAYADPCYRPYPYRSYYCGYPYVAPAYGYYSTPYPYGYYYGSTRYGRDWDRYRDRDRGRWDRDRYARRR